MAVNKVILVGNVGKDPETRYLDENTPVCKFPLATSESYRNRDGERVEQTEWHNVVLWRGLARVAEQYVKKGSQLYIEGKIRSRSYDDKDGVKRYITEIVADNMQMLGRRADSEQQDGYQGDAYSGGQQQGYSQSARDSGTQSSGTQSGGAQGGGQSNVSQGGNMGAGSPGNVPGGSGPGPSQNQPSGGQGGAGDTDPGYQGGGDEPDDLPF